MASAVIEEWERVEVDEDSDGIEFQYCLEALTLLGLAAAAATPKLHDMIGEALEDYNDEAATLDEQTLEADAYLVLAVATLDPSTPQLPLLAEKLLQRLRETSNEFATAKVVKAIGLTGGTPAITSWRSSASL